MTCSTTGIWSHPASLWGPGVLAGSHSASSESAEHLISRSWDLASGRIVLSEIWVPIHVQGRPTFAEPLASVAVTLIGFRHADGEAHGVGSA
jgi:hypothetical protein